MHLHILNSFTPNRNLPRWLNTLHERRWNRTYIPIDINPSITHPAHEKLYHTTGVYAPYSLRTKQQCGFFYILQESEQWKSCEMGPTVFRPYPKRLECLTICRCHNKGSTLSSVILRPECWSGLGLSPQPPTRQMGTYPIELNWLQKKTYKKFQTSIFVKSWEINSTCAKVLPKKFIHIHVLTYM